MIHYPKPAPFVHLPNRPKNCSAELVQEAGNNVLAKIDAAETNQHLEGFIDQLRIWNDWCAYIYGEHSRINYYLSQDTSDSQANQNEKFFRETILPTFTTIHFKINQAILASKMRKGLTLELGDYYFKKAELTAISLDPRNNDLRIEEGAIVKEYDQLVAQAVVQVDGKDYSLTQLQKFYTSENPELRKESFFAYRGWFVKNRTTLALFFDRLVKNRQKQAENLGFSNFLPLGYAKMERTDYNLEDSAYFRKNIRDYIVPIVRKNRMAQAKEIGTRRLNAWDSMFMPSLKFPDQVAPVEKQLDQADVVFGRLHPTLQNHFRRMRSENLIDLESRKSKRAGAFCTSFPDEKRVAIFCNSIGSHSDVSTLMHEMGHAFQGLESQTIEWVDLRWPTMDACEIHSMGMEYLSLRHLGAFFNDELKEKFRRNRFKRALELLCHIAVVDEFQHWVYSNPYSSMDERDQAWCEIYKVYEPEWDFSEFPDAMWARWYAQAHIFAMPFYYIDYGIAEMGAMQLAMLEEKNQKQAMESYLALCRLGGRKSVLDVFKSAKLETPFSEALVKQLAEFATKAFDSQYSDSQSRPNALT